MIVHNEYNQNNLSERNWIKNKMILSFKSMNRQIINLNRFIFIFNFIFFDFKDFKKKRSYNFSSFLFEPKFTYIPKILSF